METKQKNADKQTAKTKTNSSELEIYNDGKTIKGKQRGKQEE